MTAQEEHMIEILTTAFQNNKSVNFIVKQDKKREQRLRLLIEYSIFYGKSFGELRLNEDKTACAIIVDSEKKKTTIRSIIWDLRLIFGCVGITNVSKILRREKAIQAQLPKVPFLHLWYIGVNPSTQGSGEGSKLLLEILETAKKQNKVLQLETSTPRNFPFYEKRGFNELARITEFGYEMRVYRG
ncbi:MAG: GNAT family N-acetyltransferase [Fluviicola sp.]